MEYCLYLRKSRSDMEAEQHGEAETLARHEAALLALAARQGLAVTQIYREVVSGDTIAARPVMQQLLAEVEQGRWDGVLVMEVERLARGDTIDQGIMAQAFKYSGTKICTPLKTYDPANEFDEEYFEFGLFMSRREYKVINRRLQRGRAASAQEGRFVGAVAPYGYRKVKLQGEKGFTLEPVPEQAAVVRLIYEWYLNGIDGTRMGITAIARRLTNMGAKPAKNASWPPSTVKDILHNPVYMGKVRWKWRPVQRAVVNGQRVERRPRSGEYLLADGLHPAIIDSTLWQRAQALSRQNSIPKKPTGTALRNPLAGLLICSRCGKRMVRKAQSGKRDSVTCVTPGCSTASASLADVEAGILTALEHWLEEFALEPTVTDQPIGIVDDKEALLKRLRADLAEVQVQKGNLHDLLERGVYDVNTFLLRKQALDERLRDLQDKSAQLQEEISADRLRLAGRKTTMPEVMHILDLYRRCKIPAQKNSILKQVLECVVYARTGASRWNRTEFTLYLYPKLGKDR